MRVFTSTDNLPKLKDPVVTMGSFDGVHRGHRALLDIVKKRAADIGGESVVVTFSPHPRQVLARGGRVRLLNTLSEKQFLLEEEGIDNLVVLEFNEEFARLSPEKFVSDILVGKIGMKYFVVGFDHRFGKDQGGDYDSLERMGEKLGFEVEEVPKQEDEDRKVSSTLVRNIIAKGDMEHAADLLERAYLMETSISKSGEVVIEDENKLLPLPGYYPVSIDGTDNMLFVDTDETMRLESGLGADKKNVIITFR